MSVKPVEIKAWMGDGTEYVVRYYKEADFDAKERECAEYQRALSEAQTVEGELRARLRDEQDSHTQTHVELAELQTRLEAVENDLNLQVKDCIAAIAEAQRRGARLEAAEQTLLDLRDILSHRDDEEHLISIIDAARGEPHYKPCCANEDRTMNGGCRNCGDPCL